MKTIQINGSNYTIEQLSKILEDAKKQSPMEEVYKFHNTTKEEFEELYKNLPLNVKYYQKEVMIVAFYNKGWQPNFKDKNEGKYYGWYEFEPTFRLSGIGNRSVNSIAPSALLLQKEEYVREIFEKFPKEIEESRRTLLK